MGVREDVDVESKGARVSTGGAGGAVRVVDGRVVRAPNTLRAHLDIAVAVCLALSWVVAVWAAVEFVMSIPLDYVCGFIRSGYEDIIRSIVSKILTVVLGVHLLATGITMAKLTAMVRGDLAGRPGSKIGVYVAAGLLVALNGALPVLTGGVVRAWWLACAAVAIVGLAAIGCARRQGLW